MKPFRLSALAFALLLAACTATPTGPARLDSGTPSFDGGGSLGSGNNSGETTSSTTSTESGSTTPSDSTGTGRGINTLGSGN